MYEGEHGCAADLPRAAYYHLRAAADGSGQSMKRLDALRATPAGQRALKVASAALERDGVALDARFAALVDTPNGASASE
jgi:TPR repeat protein